MTREEAIRRIKEHIIHHRIGEYPHIFIGEALEMAIAALREQEEYEIQRHLKHFDIKEPRPEAVTKCRDLYDEDGGEILVQDSLEKKTSDNKTSDKKISEWISVEERLPEDGQRVLVCSLYDLQNIGWLLGDGRWQIKTSYPDTPTHWMPLPEPPEVEE